MDMTRGLIESDEGRRSRKYRDGKGHWTIGVGHNLDASPACAEVRKLQASAGLPDDDEWLDASIDEQYSYDLQANCSWLWRKPWWGAAGEARQAALNDMAFNLGAPKAQTFVRFYGLCAAGEWEAAGDDLQFNTAVGRELPRRYGRLGQILRSGTAQGLP